MSQGEDDLEIVSEYGGVISSATSDEWVKEGSSVETISKDPSPVEDPTANHKVFVKKGPSRKTSDEVIGRHERWLNLLGVRNKPDLLTEWDHLYNLKDQATLRKDCRSLVDQIERILSKEGRSVAVTVPQLESLITLYCKKRNFTYNRDCGWLDIISKLIVLPFQQSTLFNVFYAITTKYIPRSSKMYDLFRLLLQYHDPELCSYLDSVKVQPECYVADLFNSLLAKGTTNQLCFVFWDRYFERGDPFLIFFVALVFTKYAREHILSMKDRRAIAELLNNSPVQMNAEDVDDLLDICNVFLDNTPISVREDFHCLLFGSNLIDEISDFPLNSLMCLPISVQDLYKRVIDNTSATTACFSYFVIDTRSQKDFNAGSIPGSYNLNGALIVDEPEKFTIAMSSLMKFKEDSCKKDHICFIGSGLEEDDSRMMMVISRFLHQNREHISYVDGGYKALHSLLFDTGNLFKLSNHFNLHDFKCIECLEGGADKHVESKGWSLMEKMKKVMDGRKNLMKSKILSSPTPKTEEEVAVKHVKSTDRFGKRYRNIQSVFSISNEDSHDSDDNLNLSDIETSTKVSEKLKWSDVIKKPDITTHFQGHEVFPDKTQVSCYVALSRTHLHIFHEVPNESGYVFSSLRHSLSSVMRVTSKKKIPEFLTFKFGYELPTGEAHVNKVHCFILPKAGDCAKAIKTGIIALRPSLIEKDDE